MSSRPCFGRHEGERDKDLDIKVCVVCREENIPADAVVSPGAASPVQLLQGWLLMAYTCLLVLTVTEGCLKDTTLPPHVPPSLGHDQGLSDAGVRQASPLALAGTTSGGQCSGQSSLQGGRRLILL